MKLKSVRSRVTFIAVAASALGLAVVSVILTLVVERSLSAEIDRSLYATVDELVAQVESENELIVVAEGFDASTFAAVLASNGDVYGTSDDRIFAANITDDLLAAIGQFDRPFEVPQTLIGRDEGGDLRLLSRWTDEFPFDDGADDALDVGEEDYIIVVGTTTAPMNRTVASIRNALLVGVPIVVALIGALVWWLTGRALGPVERIRREVAEISANALDRRVEEPNSGDEIERLATTMNEMLDRLESTHVRQRRFVSDASHELRSPLAAIVTRLEVEALHGDSTTRQDTLSSVQQDTERLQILIDDLLALARSDESRAGRLAAPMALVDLDDLVFRDVRARQQSAAIDLSAVSSGTVRGIEADLSRLVRNLIDNAARHCSDRVHISLITQQDSVVLTVDDDGLGIDANERDRIFERFVRLDQARDRDAGGSGLGLAICREIAHAHNAEISVDTSPQGGARFEVVFSGVS